MGVSVNHRTFVIERDLPGSVAHAFRFWSDHALKRRWTACHPDWQVMEDHFDFKVGGSERMTWRRPDGRRIVQFGRTSSCGSDGCSAAQKSLSPVQN